MAETAGLAIQKMPSNPSEGDVDFNAAMDLVDAGTQQHIAINFASDANYTLSTSGTIAEWQYGTIEMTDTGVILTTGRNVIVPNNERYYKFKNSTAQTLTVKTSAGTGIAIPAGENGQLQCDGTNVIDVGAGSSSDTTYSISAETVSGGANFRLTGSDASTDDVKLAEGTGMTITRTDANTITFAASAAASVLDMPSQSKSADYTVLTSEQGNLFLVDDSGATRTITLPAAASATDSFTVAIKKMSASNTTVIDGNGAETIDGAATYTLSSQYDAVFLQCDGTGWNVITEPASGATDSNAVHVNSAGEIAAVTNATPAPADSILGEDDSDSNNKKSFTIEDVRASTSYSLTGTALDTGSGDMAYKTFSANTTITNNLTEGQGILVEFSAGASYTVTWPTMQWATGAAPTLTTKDLIAFFMLNSTLYGVYLGSPA